jgi:hypothetical protein
LSEILKGANTDTLNFTSTMIGGVSRVQSPSFLFSVAAFLINSAILCTNLILDRDGEFGKYRPLFIVTKLLIAPLASLMWYTLAQNYSTKVMIFFFCSWLGDGLLLANIHKSLLGWTMNLIGASGFMLSHFSMLALFEVKWRRVQYWSGFLLIPAIFLLGRVVPNMNCRGFSQWFLSVYFGVLQITYTTSIAQLSSADTINVSNCLCSFGYLMFIVSDSFLVAREFGVDEKMKKLETLGTYLFAQAALALGVGLR